MSAAVIAALACAGVVFGVSGSAAVAGAKLDAIKSRGQIVCGVNTGLAGFALADSSGRWQGLDVDVCRAVAAALFGDPGKVRFVPLNAQQRFTALQSGEVDVLSRNTTWTLSRDTQLGLNFAAVTYYDGQGFMVPKKIGVKSAKELSGATVCVQPGTTTELNLADYFRANNMQFKPVVIENLQEVNAAFFSGRCDVLTTDASGLASVLTKDAPNKGADYMILPEVISKEPLAVAVAQGDDQWLDIVRWTIFALIEAEEHGITQANVAAMAKETKNPNIARILGKTPGMGKAMGLSEDWVVNIVKAVGNYGEIWDRNIKPLNLTRGLNNLWTNGGLMYAPPIR
ncbi:MAG: amino acid ABC transporter substrate-binding protein [Hyphomicrobiaceae bacterium]